MIPGEIFKIIERLQEEGYPSYLVGGCVRDLLLGKKPYDYDIATAAWPETVRQLFNQTIPTGLPYGTVTVLTPEPVEITTFRRDGRYKNGRHPERIEFTPELEADLGRRDFTVNAMALDPVADVLVDLWDGQGDLKKGLIRSVGDPKIRFREDGLRLLRAIRFVAQLGFTVEEGTLSAIGAEAPRLQAVAKERVGAEFARLLVGPVVFEALWLLVNTGLMEQIIPELLAGQGVEQGRLHREDVLGHNIRTCSLTPPELPVRLAGLLHDVGKAEGGKMGPHGRCFPGHAARSAAATPVILQRLRYSKKLIKQVTLLVRHHMFFWRGPEGLPPVRRLAAQVGWDNFKFIIELVKADRMAIWDDPKRASVAELDEAYRRIVTEKPPLTTAELAVSGTDLMAGLGLKPGPIVGKIQQCLLEAVWLDPSLNEQTKLLALGAEEFAPYRNNLTAKDNNSIV